MKKCYILCNIENKKSNHIFFGFTGSNLSKYVGSVVKKGYEVVFLNIGAPYRFKKSLKQPTEYKTDEGVIVEFPSGLFCLPGRIRVKTVIKNALKYLKQHFESGDKVIVYHSISYSNLYEEIVRVSGKKNSVLLVAELYSDVGDVSIAKEEEIKRIQNFDKLIVMSKGIYEAVGSDKDIPQAVFLYGAYKTFDYCRKKTDDNVHIVYAGTASKIKGGLYEALEVIESLPDNYRLHIYAKLDKDTEEKVLASKNVVYEGYVDENTLTKILGTYDIGLATQNPYLDFNKSSFPSKIVTYMGCGLGVISSKSISVIESPFSKYVSFYDFANIESFKKAILLLSERACKEKSVKIIKTMNDEFCESVLTLLSH